MRGALVPVLLGLALTACAEGDDRPDTDQASPAVGDPSGTYDTAVALMRSSCAGIQVEDQPTTVDLAGETLTLTHGPLTYTGTLSELGKFTTEPVEVEVGQDTHRLAVAGSLRDQRLVAVVTAHVSGGQTCDYQVSWKGSRR